MLIKNPSLKESLSGRPMPGLRQGKNLKRLLCKPRLYPLPTRRPRRTTQSTPGWRPCSHSNGGKQCPTCPYTAGPTSEVVGKASGYVHKITSPVNCQDENVLYYWQCIKPNCRDHPQNEYIGRTSASFQQRFSQHRDYVKRDINTEASGEHFNLTPGHDVSCMQGLVLEKVRSRDPHVLAVRESHLINKFDTYRKGLNRQR